MTNFSGKGWPKFRVISAAVTGDGVAVNITARVIAATINPAIKGLSFSVMSTSLFKF